MLKILVIKMKSIGDKRSAMSDCIPDPQIMADLQRYLLSLPDPDKKTFYFMGKMYSAIEISSELSRRTDAGKEFYRVWREDKEDE